VTRTFGSSTVLKKNFRGWHNCSTSGNTGDNPHLAGFLPVSFDDSPPSEGAGIPACGCHQYRSGMQKGLRLHAALSGSFS